MFRHPATEPLTVALALTTILAAQLFLADAFYLFSRIFWLDEIYTLLNLSRESWLVAVDDIRVGVDVAPPTLFLMIRVYAFFTGADSELALRLFGFGSVWLALYGLYFCMRPQLGALPTFAALVVVWSHPLVIIHAFELRYYGPWLALTVWYGLVLNRAIESERSKWLLVATAAVSFLLCTIHYFGVLTWAILSAVTILFRWRRDRFRVIRPNFIALVGPLTLLVNVPVFLWNQQADFTYQMWMSTPTFEEIIARTLYVFTPAPVPWIILIAILCVHRMLIARPSAERKEEKANTHAAILFALASVVAIWPVLIAISQVSHPVLVERYGIPCVLIHGVLAGVLFSKLHGRSLIVAGCLFFFLSGVVNLQQHAEACRNGENATLAYIAAIEETERPVYFEDPRELYRVWWYAQNLRSRCYFLDFDKGDPIFDRAGRFQLFLRDHTRLVSQRYGAPRTATWQSANNHDEFFFLSIYTGPRQEEIVAAKFPGFTPSRVGESQLFHVSRIPADDLLQKLNVNQGEPRT